MDNDKLNELEQLKRDTGIPHLPTQLTYECRMAIAGEGPRAYEWSDKPHRVVYDLCQEIEAAAARRPALPDREAVARVIDPEAFKANTYVYDMYPIRRIDALTKADAILAMLSTAPKVTPPQKEWMGLAPSTTHNITIPEFPKVTT